MRLIRPLAALRRAIARRDPVRDEGGGVAVEFALTLPIVIMLLGGITDGALLVYTWGNMEHIGRQAARSVAVGAATEQQAQDYIKAKMAEAAGSLVASATVTTAAGASPSETEVVVQVTVPRSELLKIMPFRIFQMDSLDSTVRVRRET